LVRNQNLNPINEIVDYEFGKGPKFKDDPPADDDVLNEADEFLRGSSGDYIDTKYNDEILTA
jgi:hypothetical protein